MALEYSFKKHVLRPKFMVSLSIMVLGFIYAFIYPSMIKIDPGAFYYAPRGQPPSSSYPFGTTLLGQDVFALTSIALRNTLIISFIAAALGIVIALVLGVIAAFSRNYIIKGVTSTFIDIMCMLPSLPILMVILYVWRGILTLPQIGMIMSLLGWTFTSRAIRGFLESLRTRLFIFTSYLSGLSIISIMIKDVVPYLLRYLLVSFVSMVTWAIGNEVTISVFGAMKMEEVTIGTTVQWALSYNAIFLGIWWWIVFPILVLVIFVLALYIFIMDIDAYITRRMLVVW